MLLEEPEAVKGNRFTSVDNLLSMPYIRLFGNLALSFINKVSSGYWELFDPTNGFIAFKVNSLKKVRLDKVDNRYFFESDLLFQCGLSNIYIKEIAMSSVYLTEVSSLRPIQEIFYFSRKHLENFIKRIIYQYFVLDINLGTLNICGILISTFITLILLFNSTSNEQLASPGEANIITIFSIITLQLLITFLFFDFTHKPSLRKNKNN